MIRHHQGRDLSKPYQLILDQGKEDSLDGMDNCFIEGTVDGGVSLEKYWLCLKLYVATA